MNSILELLQTAVMLLTFALTNPGLPPEIQAEVVRIANEAVAVANTEILKSSLPIAPVGSPTPYQPPITQTMPKEEPAPVAPASQARIELFKPLPGPNGFETVYKARSCDLKLANPASNDQSKLCDAGTEDNYFTIGAIVYDATGTAVRDARLVVTTTDMEQDKTFNGTGVMMGPSGLYGSANKPYYAYTYYFRKPGDHKIIFDANGVRNEVNLKAE